MRSERLKKKKGMALHFLLIRYCKTYSDVENEIKFVPEYRRRNKERRENVMGELVITEREYCRDLKLMWQV